MILAHGVGGGADLPAEPWLLAYSASFALLITSVALRLLWPEPRLASAARGVVAPTALDMTSRVLGTVVQALVLGLFAVTLVAAWIGEDEASANIAPTALSVVLWVGMPVVSAVLGDVWRRLNPLWTVAAGLDRLRGRDPETCTATGWWGTHWPAALGLFAFLWLHVAYSEPSSLTAVALFLTTYTVAVLVGAARFGAAWVRTGDGFAVLLSLLGALSPLFRDDRGRLRFRWPGTGLATLEVRSGTLAAVLVVLGGTAFSGVRATRWWGDVVGNRRDWDLVAVSTIGLVLTIATVAVAHLVAMRVLGLLADDDVDLAVQARRWSASLVPLVLAYSIAHDLGLLVFDGQAFLALLSDPLGSGRDLFGTADHVIDFTLVTAGQLAYVQVGAIVVGHALGVLVAHDRAVAQYPSRTAVGSQRPVLAMMIGSAVAAVLLLL